MEGKEAIISNIISVAQSAADALVRQATAEKNEALAKARSEAEKKRSEAVEAAERDAKLYVERKVSVATLEMSKTFLKAKQTLLHQAYEQAFTKVLNMTDNLYRELMGKVLKKYAENNDVVIVAERDSKRLNAEWVKEEAAKLKLNLSLSSDCHKGRGGLILAGKNYDKNLAFNTMINSVRTATESKVAKKLFDN